MTLELVRTARFDGASLARITINSANAQNNDHFIIQIAQNNDHFIAQIAQNNDHFIIQIAQNNVVTISSLARMDFKSER